MSRAKKTAPNITMNFENLFTMNLFDSIKVNAIGGYTFEMETSSTMVVTRVHYSIGIA